MWTEQITLSRSHYLFYFGCMIVLSAVIFVYYPYIPPGADGDSNSVLRTLHELLDNLKYRVSRTPGQPLLDLFNMMAWSLAGKHGVLIWYGFVSLAGIVAYHQLCFQYGIKAPALTTTCLLLSPHFVAHVSGLGDFSVSLSFFLIATCLIAYGIYDYAAFVFVACVGCRFSYFIFLLPLLYYIYHSSKNAGLPSKKALILTCSFAFKVSLGTLLLFGPLISFYGFALFKNLGWQSLSYHVIASIYRLLISGLGIPLFCVIIVSFVMRILGKSSAIERQSHFAVIVALIAFLNMLILFRYPTKPEILLPLLAVTVLYLGKHHGKKFMIFTLISITSFGFIKIDLRDPENDTIALRLTDGLYLTSINNAYENRFGIENTKIILAGLPPLSILITNSQLPVSTDNGNSIYEVPGIFSPLRHVRKFSNIDNGRYIVNFQDRGLSRFLKSNAEVSVNSRFNVFFDPKCASLVRRWQKVNLYKFGQAVDINPKLVSLFPNNGIYLLNPQKTPLWLKALPHGSW